MGIWSIYRNSGQAPNMIAVCDSLEYHGEWMGDCFLTVSVKSPTPVTFRVGDYVEYRGEKYYIDYDPNTIKKAESGTYKEGFTYDNIKLYSEFHALSDIVMKDYVLNDNGLAYSQQANFSFFASSVEDLADRIQANLDKATKGQNWKVVTPNADRSEYRNGGTDITASERRKYYGASPDSGYRDVNVVCNSIMLTDAVKMAYDLFGLSFIVTDRRIIIGGTPQPVSSSLSYGKGYGLYEVEKVTDESQRVVTKMYAYGSSDNLPLNYYANLHKQYKATVFKVDKSNPQYYYCEFTLRMSYKPSMFTEVCKWTDSSGNTYYNMGYVVKIKLGSTEITARVNNPKDSTDGLVHIYAESVVGSEDPSDEPNQAKMSAFITSLTADQTIYFTAGIDKNRWPTSGIDYGDSVNYPALLSISNLMLPGFPDQSLYEWVASHGGTDLNESSGKATWKGHTAYFSKEVMSPWIMSVNADTLGEREGAVYFDGSSNDTENIHPTIESTGGNVVTYGSSITDNGYLADNTDLSFSIEITAAGELDWRELYNSRQEDAYLNMKSGYCTGRAFKILSLPKKTGSSWTVKLERSKDGSLDRYFPYQDMSATYSQYAQIRKNDTFVATGIQLPKDYVDAASKKLLEAALERLEAIDHPKQTYIPKIDELWAARDYDKKHTSSSDKSLYTNIYPGMNFSFEDADVLGAGVTMTRVIDSLTIKEDGNNGIPTFDVVLREEKEETFEQRVQSQVSSGSSGGGKSSSGQGITEDDIDSYVDGMMKVDMFSKLFEVHGKIKNGELDVNGTDTKIGYKDWKKVFDDDDAKWKKWEQEHVQDKKPYESLLNIKAKRGLWSEFFISALGVGGSGSGTPFELNELLNSLNNIKSLPTTVGHTIVWNGNGWEYRKAGGGEELGPVLQNIKDNSPNPGDRAQYKTLEYDGTNWKYGYLLRRLNVTNHKEDETTGYTTIAVDIVGPQSEINLYQILNDYLKQDDADDRYVKIDWFKSLFKVHTGANDAAGTEIEPNKDLPSDGGFNIESLVGFWTKKWVSALGSNGSGSGGGTPFELGPILADINLSPLQPTAAGALYYNGSAGSWSFVPLNQGIDETALQNYLDDKKYIKAAADTKWWGQAMSNGIVKGDIKDADDIYMNKGKFVKVNFGNNTNYDILGMSDSDNTLLVGWGIRGTSYNTTISGGGNVNIGHGTNANDSYGKYWTVFRSNGHVTINTGDDTDATRGIFLNVGGSTKTNRLYLSTNPDIYLEYDGNGTTPGVHLVGAGLWSDSYISALGSNPTQGTGFEANRLVASLNDSTLEPLGFSGKVLVNNNGEWSWEDYGAGGGLDEDAMWAALGGTISNQKIDNSHLSLKSLTFKVGASDANGVVYSPNGDANKTITFDAAANSGISVTKDNNGTFVIGYTMPDVTLSTTISDSDTSYTRFVVDAKGRIVKADKPTTLAKYGITDAVGSATKWWGQSIQTVNNEKVVKGNMTDVGTIFASDDITITKTGNNIAVKLIGDSYGFGLHLGSGGTNRGIYDFTSGINKWLLYFNASNTILNYGNVGIGTSEPACKLHVSGTGCMTGGLIVGAYTQQNHMLYVAGSGLIKNNLTISNPDNTTTGAFLKIGGLYLVYDQANNAIKVSGSSNLSENTTANIYATGAVSALGSQSSGGQDTFNADLMWQELGTTSSAKLIPQSHLNLSGYALTSEVTKTLTIKNSSGNVLGTYDGTQEKTITISGVSGNYLPLTGGTLSGNVDLKYTSIDATKNGNNVSSTQYPSSFSILDSGGRIITRTESVVEPESNSNGGRIGWYSYVRQYDSTHNTNSNHLAQRGIKYMLSKSLVGTWTIDDAPAFRTALGINLDNLVTINTAQTITGAKTFSSLLTASANVSIGGQLLVGASSADYRMHVKGGIVCEYDGTYKGSFRAMRGNFVGAFGVNGSGHTVFTAMSSDGTSAANYIDITPYNATDKYVLFPYNVKVGVSTSGTATDGAYVQIGGANLVWDASSQLLKCDKLDSVTLSTAQTITGVKTFSSAIGVNGGLTPLGTGTVGTANGGSKVWFKRVSSSEAPNNGFVIEYGNSTSWVGQLYLGDNATQGLYWNGWSNGVRGSWTKLAFVSDNVASATKLQTARSLWGNSFNGTQDISGAITIIHSISGATWASDYGALSIRSSATGNPYSIGIAANTDGYSEIQSSQIGKGEKPLVLQKKGGNVGIGNTDPACKLHVSGTGCMTGGLIVGTYTQQNHMLYVAGSGQFTNSVYVKNSLTINNPDNTTNGAYIKIGGATLTWDGSALKCDKNFYSTGAVSALGSNASGGGGGISDISVAASLSGTTLTINVSGQTGSVDLSPISGTSGNYIPLSGSAEITGDLKPASGYNELDLGNDTNKWRYIYLSGFASVGSLKSSGICIDCSTNGYVEDDDNNYTGEINNFGGKLHLQYSSNSHLVLCGNENKSNAVVIGENGELINANDKLYVKGNSRVDGNLTLADKFTTNTTYKLYVDGQGFFAKAVYFGTGYSYIQTINTQSGGQYLDLWGYSGVHANGNSVTSDIRQKNIVKYVTEIKVDDIAKSPIFDFTWKRMDADKTIHTGTSAQYWMDVLPNTVSDMGEYGLSLDYGATALAAAVFTARKVVDHELRIKQLEQENAILRKEIEELKAA